MMEGRILLLCENESSFVHQDVQILRERFEVQLVACPEGMTFRQMHQHLEKADMSFSWFALGYAARAVLMGMVLGRPSVVVAGGWDVANMPEIHYGALTSRRGRRRARFVLRRASDVLTFSEWSRTAIRKVSRRQARLVHLGVDSADFRPRPDKEDLVVTVGALTEQNLKRKGLETFVRAANHAGGLRFVVAGAHDPRTVESVRKTAPGNLEILGKMPSQDLRDLLGRAKVYVQVSYNEGFGLALAEAMSSGCVPVVTRNGSLPEVAGDVAFYVPYGDAEATASAVQDALVSRRGSAARERIKNLFPIGRRREQLLDIVATIMRW